MKKLSVVMVEDNPSVNFLHQIVFESLSFEVVYNAFEKPDDAFRHIEKFKTGELPDSEIPHFIFVDINMPQMNGFDFVKKYRELDYTPLKNEKIFLLSSTLNRNDFDKADADETIIKLLEKPLSEQAINVLLDTYLTNEVK